LSLVSGDVARKGSKGKAGDGKALSDKLAMTQEQLDTTRRDNEELKSRAADLQSQLDKLQKLIQLKNDQLARLQAERAPLPSGDCGDACSIGRRAGSQSYSGCCGCSRAGRA
jgi:pilus assembly protein FimV